MLYSYFLIMLHIYTDGAYSSKTNKGGWSFIVVFKNKIIYKKFMSVKETTNNRMELTAVIYSLYFLKLLNYPKCIIYSDSMYVIGTLTQNWKINHNNDLWYKLYNINFNNIMFKHVKGHSTNIYNNICDNLAASCTKIYINNE